jgi:hypothetical protein
MSCDSMITQVTRVVVLVGRYRTNRSWTTGGLVAGILPEEISTDGKAGAQIHNHLHVVSRASDARGTRPHADLRRLAKSGAHDV